VSEDTTMQSIDSSSEIANAVRAERRTRRLGEHRQCTRCDERRASALTPARFTVARNEAAVCRNCRAKERWEGPEDDGQGRTCAWCSERHPATLEWHHVYARATHPEIGCWLCKNCHAVATARQVDYAVSFAEPASVLDYAINVLRADAAFLVAADDAKATLADLRRMAEMCAGLADRLAMFREGLTSRLPEWADIPEAKP
jgi:hypothetical protein